jgi:peroxiredoxin
LSNQDALKKAGVDSVVVWCVNDSAVMQAWAKNQKIGLSMLKFMGDPSGELTKELDMELTHEGPRGKGLFGRCKRHAMHIVNGEIKAIRISEKPDDPAGDADPSLTLAESMLEAIESE